MGEADPELIRDLIHTYLEDAPKLLADLRRAAAREDADGLRRAAHTLKSSSVMFGAEVLSEHCRELEEMARAGQTGADRGGL